MNSYWESSWWLASKLVDLVWSNKAPIPNLSFLVSLFTTIPGGWGWVGVEIIRIKAVLSSTGLGLELELSLAKLFLHISYFMT